MTFRQTLLKIINKIQDALSKGLRRIRRFIYRNSAVTIMPFCGYGNGSEVRLRGRVLENHTVDPSQDDDSAFRNLRNIVRRFTSDELPDVELEITFNGQTQTVTTNDEGFFYAEFILDSPIEGVWHKASYFYTDDRRQASTTGDVMITPPDAQFAVVSDMDDTVIRSNVPNRIKLVANTLFKNAKTRLPFAGVAEFYKALQRGTKQTFNPIYYVSNSPYNLYDLLAEFFNVRGIPTGPIFLRDFGITERYFGASDSHKTLQIKRLLELHPTLSFILIGDSGEHDADIYAEIVRQYPGRVSAIYIRNVRPGQKWKVNEQVQELAEQVREQGVDMLLIPDTSIAARHASEAGFIENATLTEIEQSIKDDLPSNPLEAMIDEIDEATS